MKKEETITRMKMATFESGATLPTKRRKIKERKDNNQNNSIVAVWQIVHLTKFH